MTLIPEIRELFSKHLDDYEDVIIQLCKDNDYKLAQYKLETILLDMMSDTLLKYFGMNGRDFSLSCTNNQVEQMFGEAKVFIFSCVCDDNIKDKIIEAVKNVEGVNMIDDVQRIDIEQ